MLQNTKQLAARLRGKISNKLDELNAKLDDPKEMERMMMNPIAYVLFAVVYTLPITLIVDAVQNHRFAWWAIPMGAMMWLFAKAIYIKPEKKVLPTAEEVRARLIQYKEAAERKISESLPKAAIRNSETVEA